jgi:hypothetical protein
MNLLASSVFCYICTVCLTFLWAKQLVSNHRTLMMFRFPRTVISVFLTIKAPVCDVALYIGWNMLEFHYISLTRKCILSNRFIACQESATTKWDGLLHKIWPNICGFCGPKFDYPFAVGIGRYTIGSSWSENKAFPNRLVHHHLFDSNGHFGDILHA